MKSKFIDAVRRVYEENREVLFTYALSLTGDSQDAEDAIQEAFFGLLRQNRSPRKLRPYVFRCVRNTIIDNGRRERLVERNGKRPADTGVTEQQPVQDHALRQCLARILRVEREAIVLKTYGGMRFREIAVITGESVNTVASRYRRGLEKMRAMLEEEP